MFCIIDWIELQFRFGLKLLGKGITCPFTGSERSMPNAPILRRKSMKSMQPPKFVQSPKTTTCLQTPRLRPRPLLQHRLQLLHGKPEREMFTVWTQIWAKFFCPVGDEGDQILSIIIHLRWDGTQSNSKSDSFLRLKLKIINYDCLLKWVSFEKIPPCLCQVRILYWLVSIFIGRL